MNSTEINIAAATLLGWKVDDELEDGAIMCHRQLEGYKNPVWDMLPDFTTDANAALLLAEHLSGKGYEVAILHTDRWVTEVRIDGETHAASADKSFAMALTTACLVAADIWKD